MSVHSLCYYECLLLFLKHTKSDFRLHTLNLRLVTIVTAGQGNKHTNSNKQVNVLRELRISFQHRRIKNEVIKGSREVLSELKLLILLLIAEDGRTDLQVGKGPAKKLVTLRPANNQLW